MSAPWCIGDEVTLEDVPEARGVICANPLHGFGVLAPDSGMVWVRWSTGVAYTWEASDLKRRAADS